jgi:hypothetical protein
MCLRVSCRTWIRIRQSRGTDPRIQIRTKMSWIPNTVFNYSSVTAKFPKETHISQIKRPQKSLVLYV